MSKEGFPRVMLLPALSVLARVKMRLGLPDGHELLAHALEAGQTTGEPQRIIPVRLTLIEAAWLRDVLGEARDHANALLAMSVKQFSSRDLGELHIWLTRLSLPGPLAGCKQTYPSLTRPNSPEISKGRPSFDLGWISLMKQRFRLCRRQVMLRRPLFLAPSGSFTAWKRVLPPASRAPLLGGWG